MIPADPVLTSIAGLALGALMLTAGAHKLTANEDFRSALAGYRIAPVWSLAALALAIPLAEIAAGLAAAMPAPSVRAAGLGAVASLLAIYAAAIGVNLARGVRHIDCGCLRFGAKRAQLSAGMVVRNLMLAGIALVAAAASPTGRALTWLDATTVILSVAACALIYLSVDLVLDLAGREGAP